jgi:N-acetylglutamate synthase-like GNAT family acetyltransferase
VSDLRFEQVQPTEREGTRHDWRRIHNLIIPTAPLSEDEVVERAGRNHLEVAYLEEDEAVGCSTVRPPTGDAATATVIARVLPVYRRRGYGEQLYRRGLAKARELGARAIETVVLESNDEGLRFAHEHGFVEIERYVLPGDTIPFVHLGLV